MDSAPKLNFLIFLICLNFGTVSLFCLPFLFECNNGECLDVSKKCDGFNNCGDNSDEKYCQAKIKISSGKVKCPESDFPCLDGTQCVHKDSLCDGKPDCQDQSDETICAEDQISCGSQWDFKCHSGNVNCVPKKWVLDGRLDCQDGSDEIAVAQHCHREDGKFLCDHGKQCIQVDHLCDGVSHCSDGSDEGGLCASACQKNNCSHVCQRSPGGGLCVCPEGFHMEEDRATCTEIDECVWDWDLDCSQICTNTVPGYTCSCHHGYRLMSDNKTCSVDERETVVVFSEQSAIGLYYPTNHSRVLVADKLTHIHRIAVGSDLTVYWTDQVQAAVYKMDITHPESSPEVVVNTGLASPSGLAVDWLTSNLYIVDSQKSCIYVCKGGNCAVVVEFLERPMDIAVDPVSRTMLWTDWGRLGDTGKIGESIMDGSAKGIGLIGLLKPRQLTYDATLGLIFYVKGSEDSPVVEAVTLDRGRKEVTNYRTSHPYSISILADTLYWTEQEKGTIMSSNKLGNVEPGIFLSKLDSPQNIRVFHPVLYNTTADNPCQSAPCSHLCLLGISYRGYSCACPVPMVLQDDGIMCEDLERTKTLIFSSDEGLFEIPVSFIGNTANQGRSLIHRKVKTFVADTDESRVVFYDSEHHMLGLLTNGGNVSGPMQLSPLYFKVAEVEGFVADWQTDSFYWTSAEGKIYMGFLDGSESHVVLLSSIHLTRPQSLALCTKKEVLYISDWGEKPRIEQCLVDGSNCSTLVSGGQLGYPYSLTLDTERLTTSQPEERLYWTDVLHNIIAYVVTDSSFPKFVSVIPISHMTVHPFSLAIALDTIYFTDQKMNKIHFIRKTHTSHVYNITVARGALSGLALVDPLTSVKHDPCWTNNGGCSHLCVRHNRFAMSCDCLHGWKLGVDLRTCYKVYIGDGVEIYVNTTEKGTPAVTIETADEKWWIAGLFVGVAVILGLALLAYFYQKRRNRGIYGFLQRIRYHSSDSRSGGPKLDDIERLVPNRISDPDFQNFDDLDYPDEQEKLHSYRDCSQISDDSALPDIGRLDYRDYRSSAASSPTSSM